MSLAIARKGRRERKIWRRQGREVKRKRGRRGRARKEGRRGEGEEGGKLSIPLASLRSLRRVERRHQGQAEASGLELVQQPLSIFAKASLRCIREHCATKKQRVVCVHACYDLHMISCMHVIIYVCYHLCMLSSMYAITHTCEG